ncbi:hypothetical protein EX30DRAFT_339056 [Ascodesmis nigricans]|uniref:U1-type domain-containing protein n=1 Tax=Ascodesmis nigricans TaxID=341454 RepID=A0A4S2N0Y4_9PEZI|nr:hypothetical protein EX30DRAFT_339056 [Ascodesmis nigricans]
MSEYWKSTPKYWCKYCSTYVVDTPLGRKNHDATGKHQGALKRFLRDIHRENERSTNASEAAKREVARLNALVAGESSSAAAAPSTQVAKPEQKKGERWGMATRAPTETEKKRQMQELEALGVALPEQYRGDLAMPGEWTTVSVEVGKTEKEEREETEKAEKRRIKEEEERKRKWEEMDEDEKALRGFKLSKRTYPGDEEHETSADARWNVGTIKRPKKEEDEEAETKIAFQVKKEEEDHVPAPLKTEDADEETKPVVKKEETTPPPATEAEPSGASAEPADAGVVFKKRKAKNIRKK